MAPHIAEATAGLMIVAAVMLSTALSVAAAATTTTATSQRRRPEPATAATARPALAWGWWDRKQRSQDQVSPRVPGVARALSDERRTEVAAGSHQLVLDSSWTHAAFRAFHEMRAGRPSLSQSRDGDRDELGEAGGDSGRGPLAGVRRLTSNIASFAGGRGGADRETTGATETAASPRRSAKKRRRGAGSEESGGAVPALAQQQQQEDEGKGRERENTAGPEPIHEIRSAPACWHMRGRLTNAATGQTIALVEGVELARSLTFETSESRKSAADRRDRGSRGDGGIGGRPRAATAAAAGGAEPEEELEVDKILKTGMWTAFGALASSKFFMYQDPATGEPMDHFRNTPVEKKQAVRTYERFSQVVSHLLQPNGRVLVVSEWGGRYVKAETANTNGVEEVEGGGGGGFFSGGGGGGGGGGSRFGHSKDGRSLSISPSSSFPRRVFNLHFFVEARTPKEERELKQWQERPGARWIAFGSPPPRAHGCKEVYSYVTGQEGGGRARGSRAVGAGEEDERGLLKLPWFGQRKHGSGVDGGDKALASASSSPSRSNSGGGGGGLMSYTRYGECPTWYGTGRMCGLDVQARRVDSFASLPAKLRQKVLELDPRFEAGPPSTMTEARRVAREQRLEREAERRRKRSWRRPFGSWGSSPSSSTPGGNW